MLKISKPKMEKRQKVKSVQNSIFIDKIFDDGIFFKNPNFYSKSWQFSDINYTIASREEKEIMFFAHQDILNSFDNELDTKITIIIEKNENNIDISDVSLDFQNDKFDDYRKEYNEMIKTKTINQNGFTRTLYLTITTPAKNIKEAINYFNSIDSTLHMRFSKIGSKLTPLTTQKRLAILHKIYKDGEFIFDMKKSMKRGHSFKDSIAPLGAEFHKDYFKLGEKYGKVIFLRDYANFINDSFIKNITSTGCRQILSIDILPIPTEDAVKEAQSRMLGVETNIAKWQSKQNKNKNYAAEIPYDMQKQREEAKEFLNDLISRDKKMMLVFISIVILADSKEELEEKAKELITISKRYMCHFDTLVYRQMDGLNTTLPIGRRYINNLRTLTTESLAVLNPYKIQEIHDAGGIYAGINPISGNLIMTNRDNLLNPNAFILGVPGSGKSFSAKELIVFLALSTNDDILICDPEREYTPLIKALGGEVVNISAGSKNHINPLDMVEGYGDTDNPLIDKSEFIIALFEQLERSGISSKERSILDRCIGLIYKDFLQGKKKKIPTLPMLREKLLAQKEDEAKQLALSLELFTDGSLDAFAYETNVDTKNRMLVYDIMDLGKALKTMGLLIITDAMINRVTENWKIGKKTHIILDEFHVVFENEHSALFFNNAWRRFRKRNGSPTALTQNVEYLLDNTTASTMLSNSEYIVMLNQATSDRTKLGELLGISNEQMSYITNSDAGSGLLRYGSHLVPFVDKFPENTKLYHLMTTKPTDDGAWVKE